MLESTHQEDSHVPLEDRIGEVAIGPWAAHVGDVGKTTLLSNRHLLQHVGAVGLAVILPLAPPHTRYA